MYNISISCKRNGEYHNTIDAYCNTRNAVMHSLNIFIRDYERFKASGDISEYKIEIRG